uniref:Small glutamine-rich tetratricopeptide repeat (TPR)-containing, alpha n=1 Tax=Neogobius melanostomus TaxID=47308 RepID=A0A8C6TYT1_9GOBI
SSPNCLSDEQRAEAEQLKTEGNEQMKVENYSAAVEFYSQAIALNSQNAVYYCNRAAALSKLGNYAGAVQDCEQAINIDPKYSKAYGRMGLALASLNKHTEAVGYYKKALELDPDNDTYKSNLKIAEDKMDTSSPVSDAAVSPLILNLSWGQLLDLYAVSELLLPQHLPNSTVLTQGKGKILAGKQKGQQFAQQMQQNNPELIEQLRSQMRNRTPSAGNEDQP